MRILYLPAYFAPESVASSYLGDNRNQAFADAGFDIIAYAPTPSRGISSEVRKEFCSKEHRKECLYGGKMTLHRFPLYPEGKLPIFRAIRYSLCWLIQFHKALWAKNIDCIFIASTPPIQGLIGSWIGRIKRIPFVYNLQDIFPDSLVGTRLAKKGGFLWRIGRWIETATYNGADKIIVISEDFKKNILAKGVPEEKVVVIYNWVDQNAVIDIPRDKNKLFDSYGLERDKFYLCYSGNIGLTQNMDMLLEVMRELKEGYPDIHLILVGDGAYKQRVEAIVSRDGLSNVHMIPFQPYEDISFVFSLGDAGLVISKPGVGANSVPSKTWSIMSASRPVLANFDENELKDIVSDYKCGIFTKAGDKKAFLESILMLYRDRTLCKEYGSNGRRFVIDNLTREIGTKKYVDVIKEFEK